MPLSAGIIKSLGGPTLKSFTDEEKNSSLSKTQTRIDNARTRLDSLGYEAPERKDSLLVSVLKNLSRTGYAANNVIREFTDGSAGATSDKFDPFKAFGRGFSLDEQVEGKDIMEGIGLNGNTGIFGGENKIYNPSVAGMAGLALDILNPLDLLNWLSFGLGKTAIKGGSVGAEALTKTFGSKADDIVKAIGSLDNIKAGNVGELISKIGNSSNLKGDELNKLLKAMGEGIVETGSKAGDKISKVAKTRRMTLGLQNPLTLGRGQEFLKTEIPGTGAIGGAITSLGDAFKKSRIGNELGKRFSTKYTPSNLPDSVIIRNLTGNQLDNLIGDGVKISGEIPFNKEELMTIKNSLSQVKSMNGEATIKSIADATGFDTKDIMSLMENEVPFTFDIMDLYGSVRKYHPDIDPRQAFLQSVKLRKVMDDIYGDIPEELKSYFKGSVKLPNPTKTFSDTPIPFDEIDQMNPDSPMLSYVFDVKGVEVVVPIRTNADFNPGGLDNASKIIRALNSLDEKNLNAIRGQVKAMPGELGVIDGDTIRGYFHSNDIVIRQPQEVGELAETVPHEFGHSAMSNYQIDPEDYKARAMKDTFIDDYAKDNGPKEDWAVAVEWMKNRPDELQAKFPDRFNYIKKVMDENGMSADDLIQRISAQNDRTLKMDSIGNTNTQLDSVISQIDNYVSTNLISKSGQDAYKEFKGSMHELYENVSLSKVEDFVKQVEGIFRHVPVGERKAIMDIASGLYDDAPDFLAPTFYNKSQKVIEAKMGNKMPSADLRKMLLANGVKEEELKWLNLDELLNSKSVVTKDEMLQHLAMNNLDIEEVKLNGKNFSRPSTIDDIPDDIYSYVMGKINNDDFEVDLDQDYLIEELIDKFDIDEDDATDMFDRIYESSFDTNTVNDLPKYSSYRSNPESGEDYTELLLKLPQGYDSGMGQRQIEADLTALQSKLDSIKIEIDKSRVFPPQNDPRRELLNEYHSLQKQRHDLLEQIKSPDSSYQSSHWGGNDNVVAHVRFDTREFNGEKVLYIQEIQSDWHQTGRKKGYRSDTDTSRLDEINKELDTLNVEYENAKTPGTQHKVNQEIDSLVKEQLTIETKVRNAVPDAPFKKNWPNLAMKRMLRYGAENGYDRIAWARGIDNADLYSLTNVADSLKYNKATGELITFKDGRRVANHTVEPDKLADYVGGDIAKKINEATPVDTSKWSVRKQDKELARLFNDGLDFIVSNEDESVMEFFSTAKEAEDFINSSASKTVELKGLELESGGEGMKAFYDKMVPNMFDSNLKKFGIKTEPIEMSSKNLENASTFIGKDGETFSEWFINNPDSPFKYGVNETDNLDEFMDYMFADDGVSRMWSVTPEEYDNTLMSIERDYKGRYSEEEIDEALSEWLVVDDRKIKPINQSVKLNQQVKDMVLNEGQPLFKKKAKSSEVSNKPKLSVDGEAALKAFTNWRQSVVKMYNEAQIPINEMEKYVPFTPERPLKGPESQMLNTIYGTGNATQSEDPLTSLFSKLDPNIKERTTKAKTPSEVNKLLDKPWLTEDAAIAMATRGTRAIKTVELSKALDGLVSQYGRSYSEILEAGIGEIPKHYKMYMIANENGMKTLKEVYDATGIAAKDIKSFFLPEEMANVYNMYSELIMGNQKTNPMVKMFDKATNAYKKVAYLWNPGHIARDFEGNVFNNYLMGVVNPLEYVKSARLLSKPDSKVMVDGVEMTVTELLEKARKVGLLDVGAANAESVTDVLGRLKSSDKNLLQKAGSKYSQLMKEGTRKADMYTRFTGLIHNLDKGMSFNEATTEVKKFLFDYFELTPFERKVMKRIIPFYTWMRKNIPLQVEQVMTNPRNYSRIESVMTAAEGDTIDWDNRADYINDSGAFKLGPDGDYISANLPFNDLSRVPTSLDSLLQLISGVNPLIKGPIEIATNQQWFNGRPLEEYPNETREAPFAGILKLLGVSQEDIPRIDKRTLGYLFDQIPLARNLDVMSNPDNPRQLSRASSFVGGPAIYSKESVENSTVYELDRTLANFIKKLKDEGIDVPTVNELKKQPNKLIKIRDLLR